MRLGSAHVSSKHRQIGGLLASAALAFVVAFAKFHGNSSLIPVLERSFWTTPAAAVPIPTPTVPPVVLKTCNWGESLRHNLVIAIVGDTSEHTKWLEGSENANWDLAVIYYGRKGTAFTCKQCMHIELGQGAKWKLIYQFTQSGAFAEHYVHRYSQVYIPDDDIVQQSNAINRAFDVQEMYGLSLAQPALCSPVESDSIHGVGMYMEAPSVLRYGTFVEIMVPLFSMSFFRGNVTHTLSTSVSGHGLDWIWPYLLGYPQEKIAVIDEVCVIHPRQVLQRQGKASMYDTDPTFSWQTEEEKQQFAKFGYAAQPLQERFGVVCLEKARLGQVWQPWYANLLKQGSLMEQHDTDAWGSGPQKGIKLVQPPPELAAWQWPNTSQAPSQAPTRGGSTDLLVVLVIFDGRQPRWLQDSVRKPWNVIVVAPSGMNQITCPRCLFVQRFDPDLQQGRYALLYRLMQSPMWAASVADKHNYLYFPEEGVVQDISAVSTLLQLSIKKKLDLAHLAWCSTLDSYSEHTPYMQISPTMILRYGSYVEIAAPLFSWPFLQKIVLPTLVEAQTGEGLGWLWPFMAGYPKDSIAVIDDACAMRPGSGPPHRTPRIDPRPSKLANSKMQQLTERIGDRRMLDEEHAQLNKFGYDPVAMAKPIKSKQVFNFIEQPWYQNLMAFGNFQTVTVNKWHISASRTQQVPVKYLHPDSSLPETPIRDTAEG